MFLLIFNRNNYISKAFDLHKIGMYKKLKKTKCLINNNEIQGLKDKNAFLIFQEEILSRPFLLHVLDRLEFIDTRPEIVRITSESDSQQLQEPIHAGQQSLGCVSGRIHRRPPFEDDNSISQVSGHDEVVLNHKSSFFRMYNESV